MQEAGGVSNCRIRGKPQRYGSLFVKMFVAMPVGSRNVHYRSFHLAG